ncbi:MAG: hypothetical protein QOD30_1709 [Actinomycetota bacterium]|nr:hypothetical protein [Actinomycetota bacterium]
MRRTLVATSALAGLLALAPITRSHADAVLPAARAAQPVVLTGAQLPDWSQLPAVGKANPNPIAGRTTTIGGDGARNAHNGTIVAPPADARTGVDPTQVVAYRWDGTAYVEIPVQVDQRFPWYLANGRSDFSHYSGTDEELTYQWDIERWKMTGGVCMQDPAEGAPVLDPVAAFDDDDELAFMASDAGAKATDAAVAPAGATDRHEVTVADPLDPSAVSYVYLFRAPAGASYDATNGYVRYQRDANADEWIDKTTFADDDPEKLGSSNSGYGPNLDGTVCDPATGATRSSTDRFPRDGLTVTTSAYTWHASGRWMLRSLQVATPQAASTLHTLPPQAKGNGKGLIKHGGDGEDAPAYGPDLVDRWKGRAFQSSPDSSISVVGFEDEQVNWEANSSIIGERTGPVRAIREVWGADSGTNTTKTETFYRDAVVYRYHLRVHPIPPDGLYTSWDYNHGVATKYFNALHPDGVDIDGMTDEVVPPIDSVAGQPAYFDAPDPSFDLPLAPLRWEQVSGRDDAGSLVYVLETKGATSYGNPAVVPYYRDDKCFDDGTGDDPVARPWPGEATTDTRVQDGYAKLAGVPYAQVTCDQKQGAWGEHGVHFFATGDTDNAIFDADAPLTEIDAQQWQFAVPTSSPHAIGEPYAEDIRVPLVVTVTSAP